MTAWVSTTAIEWAASRWLHHRLPSTGTAPNDQMAISARTQSGLL